MTPFTIHLTNPIPFQYVLRNNEELLNSFGYKTSGNYRLLLDMESFVQLGKIIASGK